MRGDECGETGQQCSKGKREQEEVNMRGVRKDGGNE